LLFAWYSKGIANPQLVLLRIANPKPRFKLVLRCYLRCNVTFNNAAHSRAECMSCDAADMLSAAEWVSGFATR
jgi:hypothetical protein